MKTGLHSVGLKQKQHQEQQNNQFKKQKQKADDLGSNQNADGICFCQFYFDFTELGMYVKLKRKKERNFKGAVCQDDWLVATSQPEDFPAVQEKVLKY